MAARNGIHAFDESSLTEAFETLAMRLRANESEPHAIVVCGGSALILTGVVLRTTRDVDVVALRHLPDDPEGPSEEHRP